MFLKIQTKGFPGVADGEYALGLMNRIAGPNGSGKSSLFRAALWAVTGLCPDGSEAGNRYGDCAVEVSMQFGNVISRKRANKKAILVHDGMPTTQEAFEKTLAIPPRAFACMLFPMTFFSLSEAQQRDIFLAITPEVSREKVFASRVPGTFAIDWSLPTRKLYDNAVAVRRELEKEIANLEGQVEQCRVAYEQAPAEALDTAALETRLRDVHARRGKCMGEIEAVKGTLELIADYRAARNIFERQRSARIAHENLQKNGPAKAEPNADALRSLMDAALDAHNQAKSSLAEIEARGRALAAEIEQLAKTPTECPTCHRAFDAESLKEVHETFAAKTKEKNGIAAEYKKAQKEVEKTLKTFTEQQKKYKSACEEEAKTALPEVPPEPVEPERLNDEAALREQKKALEIELNALIEETGALKSQIGTPTGDTKAQVAERGKELRARLDPKRRDLQNVAALEEAFHPTRGIDAECLKRKLAAVALPGFEFQFSETLANGNEKDCFRVRRTDGVALGDLSSGQKIKFGLALAQLIADLTGTQWRAVFVEGADVVDAIPMLPRFQISVERVDKAAKGLVVEIKKEFA